MALQKTVTTSQGFIADNAYFRVEELSLIRKDKITFNVRGYKDSSEAITFNESLYSCDYSLNGNNPIAQAYEHLKTLPKFADAIDC